MSMRINGMIGQTMAMDGLNPLSTQKASQTPKINTGSSAEVVDSIARNLEETKESVRQLQELSDMTIGRKLQFNVNSDLNKVVISVVDRSTNQVIKEIPSEDVQKMQARFNKVIGLLFDEMI